MRGSFPNFPVFPGSSGVSPRHCFRGRLYISGEVYRAGRRAVNSQRFVSPTQVSAWRIHTDKLSIVKVVFTTRSLWRPSNLSANKERNNRFADSWMLSFSLCGRVYTKYWNLLQNAILVFSLYRRVYLSCIFFSFFFLQLTPNSNIVEVGAFCFSYYFQPLSVV